MKSSQQWWIPQPIVKVHNCRNWKHNTFFTVPRLSIHCHLYYPFCSWRIWFFKEEWGGISYTCRTKQNCLSMPRWTCVNIHHLLWWDCSYSRDRIKTRKSSRVHGKPAKQKKIGSSKLLPHYFCALKCSNCISVFLIEGVCPCLKVKISGIVWSNPIRPLTKRIQLFVTSGSGGLNFSHIF